MPGLGRNGGRRGPSEEARHRGQHEADGTHLSVPLLRISIDYLCFNALLMSLAKRCPHMSYSPHSLANWDVNSSCL